MSGRELDVRLTVTDFGPWQPDDLSQAAVLIDVLNEHRRPQDGKPRVTLWLGRRCLEGSIDAELFSLDPGEHLVRMTFPDGSESWGGLDAEMLAKLDGAR